MLLCEFRGVGFSGSGVRVEGSGMRIRHKCRSVILSILRVLLEGWWLTLNPKPLFLFLQHRDPYISLRMLGTCLTAGERLEGQRCDLSGRLRVSSPTAHDVNPALPSGPKLWELWVYSLLWVMQDSYHQQY